MTPLTPVSIALFRSEWAKGTQATRLMLLFSCSHNDISRIRESLDLPPRRAKGRHQIKFGVWLRPAILRRIKEKALAEGIPVARLIARWIEEGLGDLGPCDGRNTPL